MPGESLVKPSWLGDFCLAAGALAARGAAVCALAAGALAAGALAAKALDKAAPAAGALTALFAASLSLLSAAALVALFAASLFLLSAAAFSAGVILLSDAGITILGLLCRTLLQIQESVTVNLLRFQ